MVAVDLVGDILGSGRDILDKSAGVQQVGNSVEVAVGKVTQPGTGVRDRESFLHVGLVVHLNFIKGLF